MPQVPGQLLRQKQPFAPPQRKPNCGPNCGPQGEPRSMFGHQRLQCCLDPGLVGIQNCVHSITSAIVRRRAGPFLENIGQATCARQSRRQRPGVLARLRCRAIGPAAGASAGWPCGTRPERPGWSAQPGRSCRQRHRRNGCEQLPFERPPAITSVIAARYTDSRQSKARIALRQNVTPDRALRATEPGSHHLLAAKNSFSSASASGPAMPSYTSGT